jgi:sialate O-acetylesterase
MKNKVFIVLVFLSNMMLANISLPAIFSDNMVLQRNAKVKFWGWANPKEEISIQPSWTNQEYKITANNQASWQIEIPTTNENKPFTISFKGYNEIVLKNVLLGEVWLCSGQSNMEMSASWGIKNGEEEMKKANYPNIRFFNVSKATASSPQNDTKGNWVNCTPETMKYNSAIAYFFAQKIQEEIQGVPVGLIISAWGGTPAEIWIPKESVIQDTVLNEASKKLTPSEYGPILPGSAYNAMIHPFIGYKIAGTLWYQGESNVGSSCYQKTFATLISSWRDLWGYTFPFYYAQIAPYNDGYKHFGSVEVRYAQLKTLELPNTAMVVTSDISTTDDIHPKDKKTVGIRFANLALKALYNKNVFEVNGPVFKNIEINKNTIKINFDYAEGLYFKKAKSDLFEIAGENGIYYKAEAKIKNNQVVVKSSVVKNPIKVQFAWKNDAQSDLFNGADLPASSFKSE